MNSHSEIMIHVKLQNQDTMENTEKFKAEIRTNTNWKGVQYYYLYVNDGYVDLTSDLTEAERMLKTAVDIYTTGKHLTTVYKSIQHGPSEG
jgi:hypothetical protein